MNNKLKFLSLILSFALSGLAASAQTPGQIDLLLGQPGVAQRLEGLQTQGQADTSAQGVPTSQDANAVNAGDISLDANLLIQSSGKSPTDESVVQKYFRIITGQSLPVYGAKEFSQSQDNQLLFFNTVGKSYRLAPGDVIRVTLRGLSQSNQNYKIGRDGNLILNDLPPISVSGLTIEEVEQNILNILQYDDASASVFISLETARLITVQVSGAVKEPRTLAVPAYTPLSRVLAYAGGVKPNGSLRNIVLRDRDGSVSEVDFYNFLQSPTGSDDPLVTDASRVFVPNQGATVAAFGFVAQPAIYELPTGNTEISVRDLLSLSGTRILPPGLVLEAKYFDETGVAKTRSVSINDSISTGEVLNLRFVETRLQEAITVVGAVLDEYAMASNEPLSVQQVLKSGATLKRDARTDFAMVLSADGSVRAIDLQKALQNDVEKLPVGATLVVFDQQSYRRLVTADPNATDDPMVAAISQAEVAELYLNGRRLAFIPPHQVEGFSGTISSYYRLTPETNLDLAILEDGDGTVRSVSLRDLLQGVEPFSSKAGTKIHLFETRFLSDFINRFEAPVSAGEQQQAQNIRFQQNAPLARLLSRANVLRVKLNGELLAVLPASNTQSISTIFDVLGIESTASELADLVEVDIRTPEGRPQTVSRSLNVDFKSPLPVAHAINFWGRDVFANKLKVSGDETLKLWRSFSVPIYLDYRLVSLMSPNAFDDRSGPVLEFINDADIYPLFSILKTLDTTDNTWKTQTVRPLDLLSQKSSSLNSHSEVYLFSRTFISDVVNGTDKSSQENIVASSQELIATDEDQGSAQDNIAQLAQTTLERSNQIQSSIAQNAITKDLTLLMSFSRFIGGAVQAPGKYPIAGDVKLSQLLDVAGGVLASADISKVSVQYLRASAGSIIKGEERTIDMRTASGESYVLKGRYIVNLPALINEVASGVVTLSGEVMNPGEYVFSRNETIHDVIRRAGGLSPVAYPLGAVFSRESLKVAEREYNDLLATQLEQAVLQVASSDNTNAKEQVSAVLGYARQLRLQEPAGRLSLNATLADPQAPVYLEDGDSLTIPKRPAHVSILGAVNRDTIASFAPDKSLSAYLASSGGATRLADLKRAYLLLPNGESTPLSRNTIIPPGSAIVVPPKTDRLTVLGLTDLVSRVMGNIATSVLAINNVR